MRNDFASCLCRLTNRNFAFLFFIDLISGGFEFGTSGVLLVVYVVASLCLHAFYSPHDHRVLLTSLYTGVQVSFVL